MYFISLFEQKRKMDKVIFLWRSNKKINVFKNSAIFSGKHMCWGLFLIKLLAWTFATLLKRYSKKDVFHQYCEIFTKFLFWRALTNGFYIIIASSERLDQGRIVIWSSYISSYWSMSVDDFYKGILKTTLPEIFLYCQGTVWNFWENLDKMF